MTDPKIKLTPREQTVIENFMATVGDNLQEALGNAELDASSYKLSRVAARELGRRIRQHFSERSYGLGYMQGRGAS